MKAAMEELAVRKKLTGLNVYKDEVTAAMKHPMDFAAARRCVRMFNEGVCVDEINVLSRALFREHFIFDDHIVYTLDSWFKTLDGDVASGQMFLDGERYRLLV
ncbi:MAG: hypothetical protein LBI39_03210 [Puniceicoccales bacterium]|jgi:hypothetical protein|nr:hypothetical protein [Puniceicoccales bacterium]